MLGVQKALAQSSSSAAATALGSTGPRASRYFLMAVIHMPRMSSVSAPQ
jgi:hypothetical protein